MKILSKSLDETANFSRDFLKNLKPNANHATVVGLFGDLGSGKTTFTQALGRELGITEFITSPTYVIEKIYSLSPVIPAKAGIQLPFEKLIHIDAYRLEGGLELEVLGFKDLLKDPKNLILIEWPERVADILPADILKINFKFVSENEREMEIVDML